MTATVFHNFIQVCTMYCAMLKDQLDHLNWTQWTAVFILATLLVKFPFFIHYMAVHYDYKPVKKGTEDRLPEVVKMWGIVATCLVQAAAAFNGVFDFAHFDNWHNDNVSRIGLAVAVISLLGAVWVHFSMGSSWSGTVTVQKTQTLVTTGPFKLCRHPMYASCLLHCLAVALMSQNWLLTAFFTLPMMGLVSRIPREEKLMIEVFGQQYIDYKGHPRGMAELGTCYLEGWGVERDPARAFRLHEQAAKAGVKESLHTLGGMLGAGLGVPQDDEKALRHFELAAQLGVLESHYSAGMMLKMGRGREISEKSDADAFIHFKTAAGRGHALSACAAGLSLLSLEEGERTAQMVTEGFRLVRQAADMGLAKAQYTVGMMLLGIVKEEGVMVDHKEGLRYTRLAADQEYPSAVKYFEHIQQYKKK